MVDSAGLRRGKTTRDQLIWPIMDWKSLRDGCFPDLVKSKIMFKRSWQHISLIETVIALGSIS